MGDRGVRMARVPPSGSCWGSSSWGRARGAPPHQYPGEKLCTSSACRVALPEKVGHCAPFRAAASTSPAAAAAGAAAAGAAVGVGVAALKYSVSAEGDAREEAAVVLSRAAALARAVQRVVGESPRVALRASRIAPLASVTALPTSVAQVEEGGRSLPRSLVTICACACASTGVLALHPPVDSVKLVSSAWPVPLGGSALTLPPKGGART